VGGLLDAAGFQGETEGALQGAAGHGFGGRGGALAAVAFAGEQEGGMAMSFPEGAQVLEGGLGQRHIPVAVTLAAADMEEHAFGVDIADLQAEPFTQAQATRINGDQTDAMVQERDAGQDVAHFRGGEDDGEFELGIGPGQFQFLRPDPVESFFPEELDGADGPAQRAGSGGRLSFPL